MSRRRGGGNYARERTKRNAINEIEACDAELKVAGSLGLSQAEIDELRSHGTSLQDQVDRGDYTVPKGDLTP